MSRSRRGSTAPSAQSNAASDHVRRKRWQRGRWAETLAAGALVLKGYRILGRGVRTPLGEIDIVAVRGARIAFVEVKRRASRAEAEAAIGTRQRQRVRRAAELWLARHRRYAAYDCGFDLVFVLPRRWPEHLENAL